MIVFVGAVLLACDGAEPLREEALARRSQGAGVTRFTRLSAADTGVTFTNRLKPSNVMPYVYNGAGLAVADYDGNGLADLYLVSQDGSDRLFRQTSAWQFEDVTEAAGILPDESWGTGATFADFDGDGDLDLYVCNLEAPNRLYRNDGEGRFIEVAGPLGVADIGATTMAAFADFDRDGDLDLYLVKNRVLHSNLPAEILAELELPAGIRKSLRQLAPAMPALDPARGISGIPPALRGFVTVVAGKLVMAGQRDRLLRNESGHSFTDVTESAGILDQGMGLSATWWDYDDDGWPDLYVANDLQTPDRLYHNQGDGSLRDVAQEALPHTAFFGMGSDAADIDNDGRLDLLVADMSSRTHFMSKMLMGDMDKQRWFLEKTKPPQYMRNALYLNTGTERFMEVAQLAGLAKSDWTWSVRLDDFDNDGRVDLFATNGIPRFDMNPDIEREKSRLWRSGRQTEALDLIRKIPGVAEKNLAFKNLGDLKFEEVGAAWGLDDQGISHGAVAADLDRDGDLDLIVNNLNAPVGIYRNDSEDGHAILVRLIGTDSNRFGVDARLLARTRTGLHKRQLTLSRGYMSGQDPLVHIGLGEEDEVERLIIDWPSGRRQILSDLAADRLYTVTEAGESPPKALPPTPFFVPDDRLPFRHVETPFDDFVRQPLLPHRHSQLGPGLAWGDADGDGDEDLFIGGAAGQAGKLLRNDGEAGYAELEGPWSDDAAHEDMGLLWFEANGDGKQDLYVVSGGVEPGDEILRDRLYLGSGGGRFERAPAGILPELRDSGSCVVAADFDRDGDLDLFLGGRILPGRYPQTPRSHLLRNEGGRFVEVTQELAKGLDVVGLVTSALWSDVDDDGWIDLLVTLDWGTVKLFGNARGKLEDRTEAAGLAGASGWWNAIAGADLDGDGDIDYVLGNFGRNTKYRVSADHPARIYCKDYDGDGRFDIVEAEDGAEGQLPVRGRSCSSSAMPFLADKFPTFASFARADLEEIYGGEALSDALRRSVNQLDHQILVNQGGGHFIAQSLPRLSQVAPVFGLAVIDHDGDGAFDLHLAQNFFSPEPETGRMGGGTSLLLRNTGRGEFVSEGPAHSGLLVAGDAKGSAVADIDGDGRPDLVVATNDGPLHAFRNQTKGRWLCVRLRGTPANPLAIGARVTLHRADGLRCTAELQAGSGYLSQSSSCLFFGLGASTAEELRVVWPSGQKSAHTQDLGRSEILIEAPR